MRVQPLISFHFTFTLYRLHVFCCFRPKRYSVCSYVFQFFFFLVNSYTYASGISMVRKHRRKTDKTLVSIMKFLSKCFCKRFVSKYTLITTRLDCTSRHFPVVRRRGCAMFEAISVFNFCVVLKHDSILTLSSYVRPCCRTWSARTFRE